MGDGPDGILGGTADGSIGMWKCLENAPLADQQFRYIRSAYYLWNPLPPGVQPFPIVAPVQPNQLDAPNMWTLKTCPVEPYIQCWQEPPPALPPPEVLPPAVTCLAATDEVVVNGFTNGRIRIARMKGRFGQVGDDIDYDNYA